MSGTIKLLLVRHGNTFAPGDKVVWAGARTDLPLVAKGRAQAEHLGKALAKTDFKPDRVLSGPLIRTRQHSEIITRHIGYSGKTEINDALCEIDYGAWEGLSTEEIHALGGKAELDAWDEDAKWPQTPLWSPPKHKIETAICALLAGLITRLDGHGKVMAITSNGILRFLAQHCENPPASSELKVRTGHYCQMLYENGAWHSVSWNQSPQTPLSPLGTA